MRRMILIGFVVAFASMAVKAQSLVDIDGHAADLRLKGSEEYYVVVFLSPECPLCQNYTAVLNGLARSYSGRIAMYGVVPGKSYSAEEVKKFRNDYHVGFGLLLDRGMQLCRKLKATITPQAFLLSRKNEVLYSGLIDNWAASLGVQRTVVTEHYLADAIDASFRHLPVNPRKTRPVGCLINTY